MIVRNSKYYLTKNKRVPAIVAVVNKASTSRIFSFRENKFNERPRERIVGSNIVGAVPRRGGSA